MTTALDHVRYSCGIAGEEVAEHVDYLEKQNSILTDERDVALTELQALQEEVWRLKGELFTEALRLGESRKQLQSAQLDNKRLRDLLGRIHASGEAQLRSLGEKMRSAGLQQINLTEDEAKVFNAAFGLHKEIAELLSAPIDTSEVDELLTKLATLEETVTARNRGLDVEIEINQSLRDQLTTVCNALEEALGFLLAGKKDHLPGRVDKAVAAITRALGEEGKEREE